MPLWRCRRRWKGRGRGRIRKCRRKRRRGRWLLVEVGKSRLLWGKIVNNKLISKKIKKGEMC